MSGGTKHYEMTDQLTEWDEIMIKKGIKTKDQCLIEKGVNPEDFRKEPEVVFEDVSKEELLDQLATDEIDELEEEEVSFHL